MQQHNRTRGIRSIPFSARIAVILWIVVGAWYLFPPAPAKVEFYFSRRWYRWMLEWLIPLTQVSRLPIILILLSFVCVFFLLFWTKHWIQMRSAGGRSPWIGICWGVKRLFFALPILILWFLAIWGAGYRRQPVEQRLQLSASPVAEKDMQRLRILLLDQIKGNLVLQESRDPIRSIRAISSSMTRIVEKWDGKPIQLPGRVKFTPRGFLLCNGTSGVCSPFTLEPLVDKGLPDAAAVSSAAHELGHVAGFCAEDEASFVGYLAGLRAEDPFARYACALSAYMDAIDSLSGSDFEKAWTVLPDAAREDIRAADRAYRRYRIAWFSRISWAAYGHYLQTQGIDEGVRNYAHGITLLYYALCDRGSFSTLGVPRKILFWNNQALYAVDYSSPNARL